MLHFGLEFEFFTFGKTKVIPAYLLTDNLDGNPVIGELRTKPHTSLLDAVFELRKLIYLEIKKLGHNGSIYGNNYYRFTKEELVDLRKDPKFVNRKQLEVLDEKSIYFKNTGKLLSRGEYKASLQINISDNNEWGVWQTERGKRTEYVSHKYSEPFDFASIIRKLDEYFKDEIKAANRVPGVYAIKDGVFGKRIEYRSLPSNISLDKLLEFKIN